MWRCLGVLIIWSFLFASCQWHSFIIDKSSLSTAPSMSVSILSKPQRVSGANDLEYTFVGSNSKGAPISDFLCDLDSTGFTPCTSPFLLSPQGLGNHRFTIKAVDPNEGESAPVVYEWKVLSESWTYLGEPGLGLGASISIPSMAINSNGTMSLAVIEGEYELGVPSAANARVFQLQSGEWVQMGPTFSVRKGIDSTALKIISNSKTNNFYLAYSDPTNSDLVTVLTCNGTSWVHLSSPGLGLGLTEFSDLEIDQDGTLFLTAYNSNEVLRWSGTNWTVLGASPFTSDGVGSAVLHVNGSGKVAVYFYNTTLSAFRFVQWNGSSWSGLFTSPAPGASFHLDSAGDLYSVYSVFPLYQTEIAKWNGAAWGVINATGPIAVGYLSFEMRTKKKDEFFAVFSDSTWPGNFNTVKWDGSQWITVGSTGFSPIVRSVFDLKFANDGSPILLTTEAGVGLAILKFGPDRSAEIMSLSKPNSAPSTNLQANWNVSKDSVIAQQKIQYYSDEICGTKAGPLVNLNSTSSQSHGSVGSNGFFSTFRIKTIFSLDETVVWSTCSNEISFSGIWDYVGGAKPTIYGGSPLWSSEPAGFAASPGGAIYLTSQNNQGDVSVFKWDGTSWGILGPANITPNAWNSFLAVDSNERPAYVYPDGNFGWLSRVKQWDGTNWVQLGGTIAASSVGSLGPTIAMYAGEPYVAFPNASNAVSRSPSVQRWNGTSWVYVGTQQTVNHRAYNLEMAIAPPGSPNAGRIYLAFEDFHASGRLSVLHNSGGVWSYLGGSAGISTAAIGVLTGLGYSSIAVDGAGMVYVSYSEPSNGARVIVKMWNGTAWSNVDPAGLVALDALGTTQLAVNPINNHVYLTSYITPVLPSVPSTIVSKWDGATWTQVGPSLNNSIPQVVTDGLGNVYTGGSSLFGFSVRKYSP